MTPDIDLDKPPADEETPAARRRRRRQSSEGGKEKTRQEIPDGEIRTRTDRVLERISKMLRERHDEELAEVIEEDGDAMTQGFVSLTSNIKFLRVPLLILLNLIEPALAFFRIGRILLFRFLERQRTRAARRAGMTLDEEPVYMPGQEIPEAEEVVT